MQPQHDITQLLGRVAVGDRSAADELLPLVYSELRTLAESHFRRARPGHTLQPTALVHEAFVRLTDRTDIDFASRREFLFMASRAMRNILVDHARAKSRAKRGGDRARVTLGPGGPADPVSRTGAETLDLLALHEALEELATLDERKGRLVELRFFGGLSLEQSAEALDIARSTASEDWRLARAWLRRKLDESKLDEGDADARRETAP